MEKCWKIDEKVNSYTKYSAYIHMRPANEIIHRCPDISKK